MDSLTPNIFWLSTATYIEGRKAVSIEFTSNNTQVSKRFVFFPEMHLPKGAVGKAELAKILSAHNPQRFRIAEEKNCLRIVASTYSDLIAFAKIVSKHFSFEPLMIEPERQFLLQKNWGYFDAFEIKNNAVKKLGLLSVPETKIQSLVKPITETIQELFCSQKNTATSLLESIIVSQLTCIPIEIVSPHIENHTEVFLENLFFKNRFSASPQRTHALEKGLEKNNTGYFMTEIDFSELWCMLLTNHHYNIGFDTIDCECCKPGNAFEKNILPHSLVVAEFFADGFFFDSMLSSFAQQFHSTNGNKESRVKRMQEFFIPQMPVGPFYRGEKKAVPLVDALELSKTSSCRIIQPLDLHWFCTKSESFLSKAIKELKEKIAETEMLIARMESQHTKKSGLLYYNNLSFDPQFAFLDQFKKRLGIILRSIPQQLTNPASRFFSTELANAVNSVQLLNMQKFREFTAQKGHRQVLVSKERAFISADSALEVISEFSKREQIPCPIIVRDKNLSSKAH